MVKRVLNIKLHLILRNELHDTFTPPYLRMTVSPAFTTSWQVV